MVGEKEPLSDERITHCMCKDCFVHFERQLNGLPLNEYLDEFDAPVVIVDKENRIVDLNRKAEEVLGRPKSHMVGLLGGEALECDYARLPGGCGQTAHCETCTIRRVIMHTLRTGHTLTREPFTINKHDGKREMTISTSYIDGLVSIVIHA